MAGRQQDQVAGYKGKLVPIIHHLDDSIFHRTVVLFVGTRDELCAHLVQELGHKAARQVSKDAVLGKSLELYDHSELCKVWYVWLVRWDGSANAWATLTHECYHVMCWVMNELCVDDCEASAYYLDSMVEQFGEVLTTTPHACIHSSGLQAP